MKQRTKNMINLYNEVHNLASVAKRFGLSRQRVHQILVEGGYISKVNLSWVDKKCLSCKRIMVKKLLRVGPVKGYCSSCYQYIFYPKKEHKRLRTLLYPEHCFFCGKRNKKYDRIRGMHLNCYYKYIYKNSETRRKAMKRSSRLSYLKKKNELHNN